MCLLRGHRLDDDFLGVEHAVDDDAEALAADLRHHHECTLVHRATLGAGAEQRSEMDEREQAIAQFRSGRIAVLVATDVAARGLDVQGITHVVNYDIPATSEDYIHRIGRTARASASGDAITFVSPEDARELGLIERALCRSADAQLLRRSR